jgi:chloramphenicol O-acetyltransferase
MKSLIIVFVALLYILSPLPFVKAEEPTIQDIVSENANESIDTFVQNTSNDIKKQYSNQFIQLKEKITADITSYFNNKEYLSIINSLKETVVKRIKNTFTK